jgi:uncharacterized cupin superfamily protein
MSTELPDPCLHLAALELQEQAHGERYAARTASLAPLLGLTKLGARLVELAPGKRAWPRHHHYANDEMFVVLEGRGLYRYGDREIPVAAGDVLGAPAGGPAHAHQLVNNSEAPLRYLALSSMHDPDVMGYPDSAKVVVFAGSPPGGSKARRQFELVTGLGDRRDYWDGE